MPKQAEKSGRRQPWSRRAIAAASAGAATVIVGGASLALQRAGQESADEAVARVDATRFAIDASFPGNGCSYSGVVDWTPAKNAKRWTDGDAIPQAVFATHKMGHFGVIRLHFTMPTTAEKSSIDVRNISVRISDVSDQPPVWSIAPEGCGGGEYSRKYALRLDDGSASISKNVSKAPEKGEIFEPFSVKSGEAVFFDYDATVCSPQTFKFQFEVSHKPDAGPLKKVLIPEQGITMTGLQSKQPLILTDGQLYPYNTSSPQDYSATCDS